MVRANEKLTLHEAVREAMSTHPQVLAKRQALQASGYNLDSAKNLRWPSLTVSRSNGTNSTSGASTTSRIQQSLFEGGKTSATISRAEAMQTESLALLHGTQKEIGQKAIYAFIECLRAQDRVTIAEKYVKEFEKLIQSIERRVDAEINPGSELLLAKARWAQALKDLTQARAQKDKSRATLNEVLGRQNIELIYPNITPKPLKSLQVFQNDALALSADLTRYKAQIDIADAEIGQKKSELYPRVFIRHDHTQGNLYGVLPVQQTLIGMEISTGAGLSSITEIQAALARKDAAQAQGIATERSVTERIQTLWIDTNHNTQQLPTVKQYMEAAIAVAQSYGRQFPIGRKSWFEVQNAQREAFTAEVEWSDLRWSTFMLQTQLEVEAGDLAPSALLP